MTRPAWLEASLYVGLPVYVCTLVYLFEHECVIVTMNPNYQSWQKYTNSVLKKKYKYLPKKALQLLSLLIN